MIGVRPYPVVDESIYFQKDAFFIYYIIIDSIGRLKNGMELIFFPHVEAVLGEL
jgi:hypothetical protein